MAKLKFVQGATVGEPGVALFGATGSAVTVSAVDYGNAQNFVFKLVSVPAASSVVPGVVQDGALTSYSFTPDVRGGYLFELRAANNGGHEQLTRLCFGVKETDGKFMPPFGVKASEVNFEGNDEGWGAYIEAWLRSPGGGAGTPTGTGFTKIVAGVQQATAEPVDLADATERTGILPAANQAAQTMAGDVTGTTAASTIANLAVTKLAPGTQSYVLRAHNSGAGVVNAFTLQDRPTITNTGTGTLDDVATTDANGNQAEIILWNGAAAATITSLAGPTQSREIVIVNMSTAEFGDLTLDDAAATGTIANRILTPDGANLAVGKGYTAILRYDSTAARYRVVGGSAYASHVANLQPKPAGALDAVQYKLDATTFGGSTGLKHDVSLGEIAILPNKGLNFRNAADTFYGRLTANVTGARQWALPDATASLVGTDTTQTLTNKSVHDATFSIVDDADATKIAKFECSGITTGTTRTLTVPNASGTLPLLSLAQTFSALQTFTASAAFGATPATTGTARFSNGTGTIKIRDAGNTADLVVVEIAGDNQWRAGNGGEPAGYVFHGGANYGWYSGGIYRFYVDNTAFQSALPRHGSSAPYASEGYSSVAVTASFTVAAAQYSRKAVEMTGTPAAFTATWPNPAGEEYAYEKWITNSTGVNATHAAGTGSVVQTTGTTKLYRFRPNSVVALV